MNNCNNCKYRFEEKNRTPCRQCEADGDFGWWEHFDTRFVTKELKKIKSRLNHRAKEHLDGDYYVRIRDINEVFDEELAELKGETE